MDDMAVPTRTRLAALLAASVVVLAGCGTDESQASDPGDGQSHTGKPSFPASSDPATPSDSGTATPGTVAVPLYFVGDTPQGPRLFREFQQVSKDNPVDEALAILAAGSAKDPDYRSLVPQTDITVPSHDEHIVVSVPAEGWASRPDGMSAAEAKLAVQQVVHTVQGALQTRSPVDFTLDGSRGGVLGLDASSVNASEDALALVNVTEPEEGALVSGTFTANGVANSFEATVPWEIRDQSGKKVLHGFATAEGSMDKLYPWQTSVDVSSLDPGTYTFVAMTDDPSDGEGAGPTKDTKTIIVE
jgi:hypothetical protein